MSMITDARGNAFSFSLNPRRIVSLVPSTTETLYELGLQHRIVGVTRYCVHPSSARKEKIVVGGTKQINLDTLRQCQADIVIGNQEENSKELFEQIQSLNIPSYIAFPKDVDEALADLNNLGTLFQVEEAALKWISQIQEQRERSLIQPFRYAYLIWHRPWMSINDQTFISCMLKEIGGHNIFSGHPARYLQCTLEEILIQQPDVVFLSSEPFPFQEKHIQWLINAGFQANQVHCIDGEMCSWHGVRMAQAFTYLQHQRSKWF